METMPSDSAFSLLSRLHARRGEIEQTVLNRVCSIAPPREILDPDYREGLIAAVSTALEYGLGAIEVPERDPPPVPVALLGQARLAARNGVSLDTVLRRYAAGHTLLADFFLEEAAATRMPTATLKTILRAKASRFDRLIATVGEEYSREGDRGRVGAERRRAEQVESMLAGEFSDGSEINYELDLHHVAVVAAGGDPRDALKDLSVALDRGLLAVASDGVYWAWMGGRHPFDTEDLVHIHGLAWPGILCFASGEPASGIAGWRLSHRQAVAALMVARRLELKSVRYASVALLASVMQDDLLVTSLRELYLAPLESWRDDSEVLLQTLRAYFAANSNVSSAAADLSVTRHTVASRVRVAEERIGSRIVECRAQLEIALCLESLERRKIGDPGRSNRPHWSS
jgi:PucR C-terminal helix-turn-helix domain/GGDEF-like domain